MKSLNLHLNHVVQSKIFPGHLIPIFLIRRRHPDNLSKKRTTKKSVTQGMHNSRNTLK